MGNVMLQMSIVTKSLLFFFPPCFLCYELNFLFRVTHRSQSSILPELCAFIDTRSERIQHLHVNYNTVSNRRAFWFPLRFSNTHPNYLVCCTEVNRHNQILESLISGDPLSHSTSVTLWWEKYLIVQYSTINDLKQWRSVVGSALSKNIFPPLRNSERHSALGCSI